MEQYQKELSQAVDNLAAAGFDADDFDFEMEYLEPDPDGGGMFTLQYAIQITRKSTGKSLSTIGGIGSDWMGHLDGALKDGHLD
tara:strand:- start:22709 stop:22960 length:252 start_codon:yes stop_codon:yes gene_type:complete